VHMGTKKSLEKKGVFMAFGLWLWKYGMGGGRRRRNKVRKREASKDNEMVLKIASMFSQIYKKIAILSCKKTKIIIQNFQ
jgi:hypothetical protein